MFVCMYVCMYVAGGQVWLSAVCPEGSAVSGVFLPPPHLHLRAESREARSLPGQYVQRYGRWLGNGAASKYNN